MSYTESFYNFASMKQILFEDRGVESYQKTWEYQEALLQRNITLKKENQPTEQRLIFVEHPPVYTLGKSGKPEHMLLNEQQQQDKGVEYFRTNRGGDITFHGYGQLVGYPILDLETFKTDLGWYLRSLEEVIILTLSHYGLEGQRSKGETGVWLDAQTAGRERKICALGIRCSRWITMHGFALNVNTDLSYFSNIIPCGIVNKKVSSLQNELNQTIDGNDVKALVKKNFETVFNVIFITGSEPVKTALHQPAAQ